MPSLIIWSRILYRLLPPQQNQQSLEPYEVSLAQTGKNQVGKCSVLSNPDNPNAFPQNSDFKPPKNLIALSKKFFFESFLLYNTVILLQPFTLNI